MQKRKEKMKNKKKLENMGPMEKLQHFHRTAPAAAALTPTAAKAYVPTAFFLS